LLRSVACIHPLIIEDKEKECSPYLAKLTSNKCVFIILNKRS
jgi:hypothetical protein